MRQDSRVAEICVYGDLVFDTARTKLRTGINQSR